MIWLPSMFFTRASSWITVFGLLGRGLGITWATEEFTLITSVSGKEVFQKMYLMNKVQIPIEPSAYRKRLVNRQVDSTVRSESAMISQKSGNWKTPNIIFDLNRLNRQIIFLRFVSSASLRRYGLVLVRSFSCMKKPKLQLNHLFSTEPLWDSEYVKRVEKVRGHLRAHKRRDWPANVTQLCTAQPNKSPLTAVKSTLDLKRHEKPQHPLRVIPSHAGRIHKSVPTKTHAEISAYWITLLHCIKLDPRKCVDLVGTKFGAKAGI